MVLCNLPAVFILSQAVWRAEKDYLRRLDASKMPRVKYGSNKAWTLLNLTAATARARESNAIMSTDSTTITSPNTCGGANANACWNDSTPRSWSTIVTTTIPWSEHEAGDHYIVVGRVTELSPLPAAARDPLLFYRGAYRHLRSLESA